MQRIPARIGDAQRDIETPALVVDLDSLERNLDAMAQSTRAVRLRPHAKSHKCSTIAKLQIARGAVGICCQKTDEAVALVDAGIGDVLVTNEVVAPRKLERLAALAQRAHVGVLVDDERAVPVLAQAATRAGVTIDVYVELDVGAHRCGVSPDGAIALARAAHTASGLRFRGLQAYHGAAQHLRDPGERERAIAGAAALAHHARTRIVASGVPCDIVSGAGTGTWRYERDSGLYDELQPGSYVFMDVDYARNVAAPGDLRFEQSLFVLAGVMSVACAGQAVVDAGLKAFAFDSGLPQVHARSGVEYVKASDEHGVLRIGEDATPLALGDRVLIAPGHCDPTVNLYDHLVGVRRGVVEAVWPVEARGALG
jgi:D-serine deaminase-like pyridoxal phosphate-dependent protein